MERAAGGRGVSLLGEKRAPVVVVQLEGKNGGTSAWIPADSKWSCASVSRLITTPFGPEGCIGECHASRAGEARLLVYVAQERAKVG